MKTTVLHGLSDLDCWEFGAYCGGHGIGTRHYVSLAGGFTFETSACDQETLNALWTGYCREKLAGRPPDRLNAATEAFLERSDLQ